MSDKTTTPELTHIPPKHVLEAFCLEGDPVLLPGGQGTSTRVGNAVIKPGNDEGEASWVAELMNTIQEEGFRVPRPVRSTSGAWIHEGWIVYEVVEGKHVQGRWEEKIEVCQAFHKAIATYPKPAFLDTATHGYAVADRVAWGEQPMIAHERVKPALERLRKLLRPIDVSNQLTHVTQQRVESGYG